MCSSVCDQPALAMPSACSKDIVDSLHLSIHIDYVADIASSRSVQISALTVT